MAKCALTTSDNQFNPFTQFEEWLQFDMDHNYNSCGLLDRIAKTSDQLSDAENEREIERAIDEIVKYDPLNIYRKIRMNSEENEDSSVQQATVAS